VREFGSEFPSAGLPDNYFDILCSKFQDYEFLRSGRDSLEFVSQNIIVTNKCILLPAYCCESMIEPFKKTGWRIYFYRLNNDLTVDIENMIELIRDLSPRAVLLMNFFGLSQTQMAVNLIKNTFDGIFIIEDFTHCLFSFDNIYNSNVDYYVASIRKWIGINDGAIVLSKTVLHDKPLFRRSAFVELRKKSQILKKQYLVKGDFSLKEEYRDKLQKAEMSLAEDKFISKISDDSLTLLRLICASEIQYARQQNFRHLFDLIKGIPEISFPLNIETLSSSCPFSLPILTEQRDEVQKAFAFHGVYAPLLWVLDDEAQTVSCIAELMERKMLSLPIDQRYGYEDMKEIAHIIHTVYNQNLIQ
jgi:hypothetical protein